mmetsp:Transcript_4597/g.6520  ORF Transcript_4597/g.6520 Transcript_4597/m.6520 type:complete len:668 (-) Transcript_4597:1723-3726(-)|eukprot:CAMPEP_0184873288 /NCGR_PEP_ID=MMETSP0580-20130426/41759_1 /TAXON_ID=1118495 /ORGANISM="Dactyliosolen fragilissimus" /LENGTH=667 /DNA_ID=CAMNT_0027376177 /DNA_START=76 /DNA_END=2079 /DNA_ORIENTATION=+
MTASEQLPTIVAKSQKDNGKSITTVKLNGIIFRRTIRAYYATLDIILVTPAEEKDQTKNDPNTTSATTSLLSKEDLEEEKKNKNGEHVVVLIQFLSSPLLKGSSHLRESRSHLRRICKLGNEVCVSGGFFCKKSEQVRKDEGIVMDNVLAPSLSFMPSSSVATHRRYEIKDYTCPSFSSSEDKKEESQMEHHRILVVKNQRWDMVRCQAARIKHYPLSLSNRQQINSPKINPNGGNILQHNVLKKENKIDDNECEEGKQRETKAENYPKNWLTMSKRKTKEAVGQTGHGGGIGKRMQGEIIADFLVQVMTNSETIETIRIEDIIINNNKNKLTDVPTSPNGEEPYHSTTPNENRNQTGNDSWDFIQYLNSGSGVMDVAGGSGHVSLALGLRGIRSTVIDPRENVGKLPGRDRKVIKKASKVLKINSMPANHHDDENDRKKNIQIKPVPFSSLRAWFVSRPEGVDTEFRETDRHRQIQQSTTNNNTKHNYGHIENDKDDKDSQSTTTTTTTTTITTTTTTKQNGIVTSSSSSNTTIPICSMCSPDRLLPTCTAIIALHPDEATGSIVDFAVQHRIPFVVVPCCVFSRLFPMRWKPLAEVQFDILENYNDNDNNNISNNNKNKPLRQVVSTYTDLIEYLVDKDPSICISRLNFDGANLALWSTFSKINF